MRSSKRIQEVEFTPGSGKLVSLFDENLATTLVRGIFKLGIEKMDKLREVAAKILQRILYHETLLFSFIPQIIKLKEFAPRGTSWNG